MNFAAVELAHVTQGDVRPGIRWSSVFAGICVGIAVYALAMLVGVCVGLVNGLIDNPQVSVAALGWNLVSALGAALLGTFVAARSADLRRAAEGAMHGLVVWAGAALLMLLIGLTLVRDVAHSAVLLMAAGEGSATSQTLLERSAQGDVRMVDVGAPVVRSDTPSNARADRSEWREMAAPAPVAGAQATEVSAYAALMVCAALAISFFGAIAGGLLGTRAPRRDDPLDHADWQAAPGDFQG
ncbi:MAG TPA: hypothetical protein VGN52_17230 [Burkholderiales bacterium]|jgi:hypothetical protein